MPAIVLIFIYILSPAAILYACRRFAWMDKVGAVLWAYAIGLILGNFNLLPHNASSIQDIMTTITVPLAIPLMLFSSNIRDWKAMAKSTFLSLVAGIVSVILAITLGYYLLQNSGIEELNKVGGMLVGVYTGGTPNLAALKLALGIDSATYLSLHTYDMLVSFVFLVFMISIGQKSLQYILPKYANKPDDKKNRLEPNTEHINWTKKAYSIAFSTFVGIVIFAIAGGISLLFDSNQQMLVVILIITTLGIVASFNKKISTTPFSFETGMYLILVFSVVVASMVDIKTFISEPPTVFYYILFAVGLSLALHILISKLLGIDTDTTIVVSTALICSPAFVPFVATAINNKKVILGGITAGLIGFAIGNYMGIFMSTFLQSIK